MPPLPPNHQAEALLYEIPEESIDPGAAALEIPGIA